MSFSWEIFHCLLIKADEFIFMKATFSYVTLFSFAILWNICNHILQTKLVSEIVCTAMVYTI